MASPYMPEAPCLQEQDLAGKVAVITGASKGIGRAIALNLATRGCAILGTYSSPTSAHQFKTLSHTISALYTNTFPSSSFSGSPSPSSPRISHHTHAPTVPKLIGITANILSSDCALMIAVILEKEFNSRCDIFINNASVAVRRRVGEIGDGDVSDSLMGNVTTPMRIMETLVRKMLLRQDARVVIVTREMVHGKGTHSSSLPTLTSSALHSLSKSWSLELPLLIPGTTVNVVSVGLTDTPGFRALPASLSSKIQHGQRDSEVG
ncbi:NAD(P)-binding protein [Lepidopterella palustris CBS 459.81]|uniref:NAD(P)-binding protein n=1 Tax=Lepidopterella palustris CBS 459.81 TaxID=1314670 RepID=A0A8E2JF13_9PEZI|nr:NAD(P)-binding protein [Lepidopterella palustris CBS 459.81]